MNNHYSYQSEFHPVGRFFSYRRILINLICILFIFNSRNIILAQNKFITTDVFGMKYWIENKGQFGFPSISSKEILYTFENQLTTYILSRDGLYIMHQIHNSDPSGEYIERNLYNRDLEEETEEEENHEKERKAVGIDTIWLKIQFKDFNSNFRIRSSHSSPHYFTNGIKEMRSFGYKEITFENYYPNIDLIWKIAETNESPKAEISYSFKVKAGADIRGIQFNYRCIHDPKNKFLNQSLDDKIKLQGDSITLKHSHFSFFEKGLKLKSDSSTGATLHYVRYRDHFGFQIIEDSTQKVLYHLKNDFIIDPFISIQSNSFFLPILKPHHIVANEFDAEGNAYFYGEAISFIHKLCKYDPTGKLLWTMIGTRPLVYMRFNSGPFGTIRVDRYNGDIYCLPGSGPPSFFRVTTDGDYDHYWAKPTTTIEFYDIIMYPKYNSVAMFNGFVKNNTVLYNVVDSFPEGRESCLTKDTTTELKGGGRDYVCAAIDDYGKSYALMSQFNYNLDTNTSKYTNRVMGINDSFTRLNWINFWGFYSFKEKDNNVIFQTYRIANPYSRWYYTNHFKGIATHLKYLYVFNGKNFVAMDKNTGKRLAMDTLPVFEDMHSSGIAVDSCENIYLGGDSSKIYVYSFDGKSFHYRKTLRVFSNKPNAVYDIKYNFDEHVLYVSGDSFAGIIECGVPCGNKTRVKTSSLRSCGEPLWVKITNPDSLHIYTFEWRNANTHKALQTTTIKGKYVDTFYKPQVGTDYKLFIFINQFGTGTFKTVKFTVRSSFDSSCQYEICEGDTITINGKKIFETSQFTDSLKTYFGCDSIIDYSVIKKPKSRSFQFVHRCFNDSVLFNRFTITSSGEYFDTITNSVGCDSLMKMQVFFQTDTARFFDTICNRDTFTFYNQKISSSGIYLQQVQDTAGCKYIERQQITVLLDSGFQRVQLCEGDTFLSPGNKKYFDKGQYLDTLVSSKNCDSILHTEITLLSPSFMGRKIRFCLGDSLFLEGKWRFKPGIFFDTLINSVGCDSILQTETMLFPNRDSSAQVFLCNQDSVIFKGKAYLLPAKILELLKDNHGCDSAFQLSVRNSSVSAKFSIDSTNRPEFIFINESIKDSAIDWTVDQVQQTTPTIPFQYKFEPKGQYHEVCLEAINSDGCKDTFCMHVYASKIAYKLYNIFTPNADEKNDLLAIDYIGGNFKYDVAIFNRWGELMYESKQAWASDPTQLWNGRVNNVGAECPSGTYFALFNFYIGEGSKPIFTEIPVTLIRTP